MNSKLLEHALLDQSLLLNGLNDDMEITSITYDSRQVVPGSLFICKGANFKKEYLISAQERGAVAYLSETKYDIPIGHIHVSDIRKAMAVVSSCFYNNPTETLDLLGITGTKGKTTATFIARSLLNAGNKHYGMLSSILTDTGTECKPSHLTTPESPDLQQMLSEIRDAQMQGAVMEVSSQGLAYDRVYGVKFAASVFLNIGQDHISPIEHKSFEEYFDAKKRIFSVSEHVYINCDDEHAPEMLESARACQCKVRTFGFSEQADIRAYNLICEGKYTKFRVCCQEFDRQFILPMLGTFNVYNALAAICLCLGRIKPADMVKGMRRAKVPGRMEIIEKKDITVIVDYAHNQLSLESLLTDMRRQYPGRRIVCVFGCPGGKAFVRRADMGQVAARLADYTILTADDPDFEDVTQINEEIGKHLIAAGACFESISDRSHAIEKAILNAKPNDIIILAGKGAEEHQKTRGEYVSYEGDLALSKKYLNIKK